MNSIPYRHSMQLYVPVGRASSTSYKHQAHYGAVGQYLYVPLKGGMRADDGFEALRSVDAKAPVAASRSDRQAMRRSRRCVSQHRR